VRPSAVEKLPKPSIISGYSIAHRTGRFFPVGKTTRQESDLLKSFENAPASASLHFPARTRIVCALPWLVLALCLAATYGLWRGSERDAKYVQQVEFDSQVKDVHVLIAQRLAAYEQVLRGAAGLFTASAAVTGEEFRAYVTALKLKEHYPGIQGVGFSLAIPARDKARHMAALRRQGFPDYAIHPGGERESYAAIVYLEPFIDRNLRAFGYDMFSEPVRRAAMERARDTGVAAVSGKVRLVQENDGNAQAGFLMYLPVYRNGTIHDTPAGRHADLLGWVHELFRMDDLMLGVFGQHTGQLDIEIYDGDKVLPETLMYDSDRRRVLDRNRVSAYASVRTLDMDGNHWTVAVYSRPAFEARMDREKPRLIAFAGTALSVMIGLLIRSLTQGRTQAIRLAETMNRELIKSEGRFHSLFTDSQVTMLLIDPADGRIVDANRAACAYYGYPYERLLAMPIGDIDMLPPEALAEMLAQIRSARCEHFLFRHRLAGGEVRDVEVHSGLVSISGQTLIYSIVHDITGRMRAEERLRQLSTVIEPSPASAMMTDPKSHILYVNPRFTGIAGYAPDEVFGKNPRLLKSGQTPRAAYAEPWATLVGGGNRHGEPVDSKRDRDIYWEETHISPVGNAAGAMAHYAAINLDIAGRRRMEEALRENERRLRRIAASVPGCVYQFRIDPEGRMSFPFMSDGIANVYGIGAAEAERSAQALFDPIFEADLPMIHASIRRSLESLERWRCEYRIHGPDGALRWLCGESTPQREADGGVLWHGLITDITESRVLQERLRQSHDLLQNLSAQVPGLIYQYQLFPDGRSRMPYASAAIGEIYEVTPEQVREDATLVFDRLHPDDNEGILASIRESARTLEPWRYEYRIVLPRQGLCWRRGDARPQRLADGSTLWHGFITDITERKRSEGQEQARNRIFELLAGGGTLPEILVQAVKYLEWANERLLCMILLADESGRRLKVGAAPSLPTFYVEAMDGLAIGEGTGSSGTAVFRDVFVAVEDIRSHPDWAPFRDLAAQAGLMSCWSEPIRSSKGAVLGAFAVYQKQPGAPGARDLDLIRQAAQLAGIAIERKHIEAELLLASSVYQASGEAIMVTDAAHLIVAVNPAFTRLTGYALPEVAGRNSILMGTGGQGDTFDQAMRHVLATAGHWQGEVWDRRKNGETFAAGVTINAIPDKDGKVYRYVALLSDITEKKRSDEIIWEHANYDSLTHLPNRRLFRDRLQQEIKKTQRAGLSLALLFIDLDRFKEVNDTLGHNVGDLLLVEAAQRIHGCVRDSDTVARLGGDEFTVILSQLNDVAHVERIAQAIVRTLGQPFRLGEEMAYVSASVGITMYPADAVEVEDLLKNADQAMYVAKSQGRNGFSYFTASMQNAARERLRLINDLRGALAADQFSVYFQPIVDLRTGRIAKAEALLRWRHPVRGLVNPGYFIPLAEEVGLIRDIGDWVFREAARWMRHWHGQRRAIQVSVNKSPVQFISGHCYADWKNHLQDIGLPGESLVIEITEGFLLGDRPEVARELEKFHDLGMKVAIDDFGTGYSSLSYLKRLDIDYLKIDRAFIRDMDSDPDALALSEAIIVMAHKLGLQVIAEGVETAKQRDLLAAAGCDYGQGYLFAEPMPAQEFDALLSRDAGRPESRASIPVKIPA
jgi:diguanylate cyclase (GGDEF)-like protein/PAS domain S-box-containing protein